MAQIGIYYGDNFTTLKIDGDSGRWETLKEAESADSRRPMGYKIFQLLSQAKMAAFRQAKEQGISPVAHNQMFIFLRFLHNRRCACH